MTTKKKATKGLKSKPTSGAVQSEKPIALTLKIDGATYQRLSAMRAKQRKTAQDVLSEALMEHLDRAGA
jgi:hypothetical protein